MSEPISVDPTRVWACESCGGDLHAAFVCPNCGEEGLCALWEEDGPNRWSEPDKCEFCGTVVIVSGKDPDR